MHIVHPRTLTALIGEQEFRITELVTISGDPPPEFVRYITVATKDLPLIQQGQQVIGPDGQPAFLRGQRQVKIRASTPEEAFAMVASLVAEAEAAIEQDLRQQMNPIVVARPNIQHNGANMRLRG